MYISETERCPSCGSDQYAILKSKDVHQHETMIINRVGSVVLHVCVCCGTVRLGGSDFESLKRMCHIYGDESPHTAPTALEQSLAKNIAPALQLFAEHIDKPVISDEEE